ncbi:MAG: hypothetical protein Q8O81_09190 [Giesbergeria sp.]|nr:hypothetical protein [Giesbergeria sp.]
MSTITQGSPLSQTVTSARRSWVVMVVIGSRRSAHWPPLAW